MRNSIRFLFEILFDTTIFYLTVMQTLFRTILETIGLDYSINYCNRNHMTSLSGLGKTFTSTVKLNFNFNIRRKTSTCNFSPVPIVSFITRCTPNPLVFKTKVETIIRKSTVIWNQGGRHVILISIKQLSVHTTFLIFYFSLRLVCS